jgi:putative PIN family toxin of toxin-antitoxin system
MKKVILDTNVIVSALISKSIPTQILFDLVLNKKVEVCLSDEIFAEYLEVLNRNKFKEFPNFKAKADIVLNKIREISSNYNVDVKILILTDTSDNKFLELAAVSSADYLITGNSNDFIMSEFEYTRILSPRQFWDEFYNK